MMEITLLRIDSRLIHGQVVQGWLPAVSVKEVVVVSETASSSKLMSKMMRMSLPQEYSLQIFGAEGAARYLKEGPSQKVMVLVEDLKTLFKLMDLGLEVKEVNIGNTKYEDGKKQYGQGVFLSEEEVTLIKQKAVSTGASFVLRTLPTSLSTRLF